MNIRFLTPICIAFLVLTANAHGDGLFAVSGDGGDPAETLFRLSQTNASSTFVLTLGNGTDGEAIGFNPTDGLIYHASGHDGPDVIFEKINSSFTGTIDIPIGSPLTDEEAQALTWDVSRGKFLWKQDHGTGPLFEVASDGTAALIGDMDHQAKGLAFVGSTLYSVDVGSDLLRTIDPATGATLDSVSISLAGFTIEGGNGLATDPTDGTLWALLKAGGSFRELVTIDPKTGVATHIGTTDVSGLAGLAFNKAIPEPSTLLILSLVGLGVVVHRRRR